MAKRRVLIVDDEPGFTRLVKLNLEGTGRYEVREEHRGDVALAAARDFHPDVVVLDVLMPDVDGGEVAARLSAELGEALPIVFISAMAESHAAEQTAGRTLSRPFLAKPVTMEELVGCIDRQLDGARAARRAHGRETP